jgi:four helix bundle protein
LPLDVPDAPGGGLYSREYRAGVRRRGKRDKAHFMNVAQASREECRYYLILSKDLAYVETEELAIAGDEVSRLRDTYASPF